MLWQTSRRIITLDRPLVMGVLNVTPDSFSDAGENATVDAAVGRALQMVEQGADIIDIGGESTRPGSTRVAAQVELERTIPVIAAVAAKTEVPLSIDTSKSDVARAAIDSGAEIINDISGLRWDPEIADLGANTRAGLILMHSRGTFETMHSEPPVNDVLDEVTRGSTASIEMALARGVDKAQICLDIGIGFSKTLQQNLELLARLGRIVAEFPDRPILVGTSRKSFIGKILGGVAPEKRLGGSIATAVIAAANGARILRVHDVEETVAALKLWHAVEEEEQ
jgi:dihydropteroate synthase